MPDAAIPIEESDADSSGADSGGAHCPSELSCNGDVVAPFGAACI
jgi:hypothetical protein